MRLLYGIQGTGHGHISRAKEILPKLTEQAEVDILVSGYNCKLTLEQVEVMHKRGLSLTYNDNGGVSYLQTALNLQPLTFLKDLGTVNTNNYDLIISDYEPITAWASIQSKVPVVGLSHQASFLSKSCPRPKQISLFAESLLKYFAPVQHPIGFHFKRYDSFILPPVIRQDIRDLNPTQGNHITVYLPSYDPDFLASKLRNIDHTDWHIFSPLCNETYQTGSVTVNPVGNRPFLESLESAKGVIAGAGFELCAESMFLGKKLLAIPIKNQYEQLCNAAALEEMGVKTTHQIDEGFDKFVSRWLDEDNIVKLHETADIDRLVELVLRYASRVKTTYSRQSSSLIENSWI